MNRLIEAFHAAEALRDQTALPARCAQAASYNWDDIQHQSEVLGLKINNGDAGEEALAQLYAFYCRSNGIDPMCSLTPT